MQPMTTIHTPRFADAYEGAEIIDESGYHQMNNGCGCSRTTPKGAYRDVTARLDDGTTVHYYHQTPVVAVDPARRHYRLDSGGYHTVTTKARMNDHTPIGIRVFQRDYDWFVSVDGEERPFRDGMIVEAPR